MTSISAVNQNNQQNYATSEKKESASIFNNPRATESTTTETAASNQCYSLDSSLEEIYDQYIREIVENFEGATEQEVVDLLAKLGFTKEVVLQLSKDEFFKFVVSFDNIFEFIYETSGDKEKKMDNIAELINYSNSIPDKLEVWSSVSEYACKCGNATLHNMIRYIAKSTDIDLPKEIQEKLKNAKDISELSNDELQAIVKTLISNKDILEKDEKININTQQLLLNILFNIPQSALEENSSLRTLLIDEVRSAQKTNTNSRVTFLAMLEKLNNSQDGIISACNDNMLDSLIENIKTPDETEKFLLQAQEIIDSGNVKQKSLLADALANNLNSKLDEIIRIDEKLQNGEELEPSEKDFLNNFEQLEQKYQVVAGHAYVRAQKNIAQKVHDAGEKVGNSFNKGAYQRAYNISLKDKNVNPVDATQRIDEISGNKYSQTLTELGYELPTSDNIDSLREQAEQGVFDNKIKEYYASEQNTSGIGYQQDSKTFYENASYNAETLRSQILGFITNEENDYTVERVKPETDNNSAQSTLFNKINLSNYTGSELAGFISNGMMKFSDAVKQYSNHLSESGKRFVVQSIKVMDEGRQVFALNSTSNTARWEIMKKAGLLDEDLNVDFDFNHEKLREKYQG